MFFAFVAVAASAAVNAAWAGALDTLLRNHASIRTLLLETETGTSFLSQVLRRGGSAGSHFNTSDVFEAIRLLEAAPGAAQRNLGDELAHELEPLLASREVRALERRMSDAQLTGAEREVLGRALREQVERWARLEASQAFGHSPEWIAFTSSRAHQSRSLSRLSGAFGGRGVPATPTEAARALAHPAITTDLFHGEIVSGEPLRLNGNMNAIYKVRLYNPQTRRFRDAIFKPRTPGDGMGWNRVPMEYVAYEVNLLLGLDYIPPAAYRYGLRIGRQFFEEGALLFFVPEAKVLGEVAPGVLPISDEAIRSDSRILNVLLQNSDAHSKNLLAGVHWTDGATRPVFIDFGASLRPGADVSMLRYSAAGNSAPITTVRVSTLARLRALDSRKLERAIGPFTSREEIAGILARRDEIVSFFDRLRGQYGDASVLIPE